MGRLTSYYSNSVAITAITRSDQGNSDSNCISRAIIATANANSARSTLAQPPNGGCCNAYATPAGAHSPERGLRAQPRRRAGNERGLDGADEGGAGDGGVDESASEGGASEGSADECSAEQDGAGEEGAGEGGAGAVTLDREQDKDHDYEGHEGGGHDGGGRDDGGLGGHERGGVDGGGLGGLGRDDERGGGGSRKLSLRCEARAVRRTCHLLSGGGGRTRGRLAWADIDRKRRGRKPAKSRRSVVLVMLVA